VQLELRSPTGSSGTSFTLEGVNGAYGRSLAISGDESGSPDAGTITHAGTSKTVASGLLYAVNDDTILRVYLDATNGVDIGSGYDNTGVNGNGSGFPGFRGLVRDLHDSRMTAVAVPFKNFGQAEKYINFYHANRQNIQVFFITDITETLMSNSAQSANNAVTNPTNRDKRNWEFHGAKGGFANPSVPRWSVTFSRSSGVNRDYIIDTCGFVKVRNIQFDIDTPVLWLFGTRGGFIQAESYIGVRQNGNFSYGIWRVGEGGTMYDFSFGDYIKTASQGNATYHYNISQGGYVQQYPQVTLGHGGNAYIMDGNYGVAEVGQDSTFSFNVFKTPHTGSDDSTLSSLRWPDGSSIPDTTRDFGSGVEEFHQAMGPYTVFTGTGLNYDPTTETQRIPAFLIGGQGATISYLNGDAGTLSDCEPVPFRPI
jgi:hypothetical protein